MSHLARGARSGAPVVAGQKTRENQPRELA